MLFNSNVFLVFLPTVIVLFYAAPRRGRWLILLAASYLFYGWWDWRFLGLLLLATSIDYVAARAMEGRPPATRKAILVAAVSAGLAPIAVFKYADFALGSVRSLFEWTGASSPALHGLGIVLPVGISFYTFQSMSYTIDVYRGVLQPCRSFAQFALYVTYFPQLVAGPIERAPNLLPQLQRLSSPGFDAVRRGVTLMLVGAFKKVVIGDVLAAPYANAAFADPAHATGPFLLFGLCMFSLQIYADFSGYSDIARGVSRFFGVELMINFRQPYLSASITEFWRRWHVSLSFWLRDYLYVPLGGNRAGRTRTYLNLLLTMLLGGLWHGANWKFVVWGGLHGLGLAAERAAQARRGDEIARRSAGLLRAVPRIAATQLLVLLAWVFFRAESFEVARIYLGRLPLAFAGVTPALASLGALGFYAGVVVLADLPAYRAEDDEFYERLPWPARGVLYAALAAAVWLCWPAQYTPFIYFQF